MSDLVTTRSVPAPGQRWSNLESFGTGQLGTSSSTLYTAPSTTGPSGAVVSLAILRDMWLCNTDSSDRTVTLYIVASGGSPGASNAIISGATVKANQSLHYSDMATLIPAGGTIRALASAADVVTYFMTGEVVR